MCCMSRVLSDVIAEVNAGDDHHLYSSLAPVYEFIYDRHFDYDDQLAVVQEAVPADATSILEGGCGTGQLLSLLDTEYDRVVGVDVNKEMAGFAREAAPDADVLTADMTTANLDEQFDAVVMLGRVLPHFTTDEEATQLLANCHAHLVPGGVIVCNTFDVRGLEDGHVNEDTFASEDYTVARTLTGFVTDVDTGRWGFDAEYVITDNETGETVVAEETMHLRAHAPEDLESYFSTVGFEDVSFVRESEFSLRAVARKPLA